MASAIIFGFAAVFGSAVIMTLLTIFRQSKISAVYSTLATVLWFALAGINFAAFAEDPIMFSMSFVWFAAGVIVEIIGVYITLETLKADNARRDLQL